MAAQLPVARRPPMFVWDFDWSLVNENTDTWLAEKFGELDTLRSQRHDDDTCWTECMQGVFDRLHERGVTKASMEASLLDLPLDAPTSAAIQLHAARGCPCGIISDSNTVFIELLLNHHGLQKHFPSDSVFTNPAAWDAAGRLQVERFHRTAPGTERHECALCPPNLCKRKPLAALRALKKHDGAIVYVGDGHGDLCPALALGAADCVLARKGYRLAKELASGKHNVLAQVKEWEDAAELLAHVTGILEAHPVAAEDA